MKKTFTFMLMLMISIMTFAKDIKTVVFTTTPQMHCAACEKKIKDGLRFEKGVKKIATNIEEQTVTVQYDAEKTTPAKLLKGLDKAGYKARQLKKGEKVKKDAHASCENM